MVTDIIEANKQIEALTRQLDELLVRATTDDLTGALRRVAWHEQVTQAIGLHSRGKLPAFSVALIDVDNFKQINDRFGHAKGDQVLKGIVDVIKKTIAHTDHVCRLGGDEFAILFHRADAEAAETACKRILAEVTKVVGVTLSIGIADSGSGTDSIDWLTEQADNALYAVKQAGRNGVRSI